MLKKVKLFLAGLITAVIAVLIYLFCRKKDKTEEIIDDAKDFLDRDIQSDIDFIDRNKDLRRKE